MREFFSKHLAENRAKLFASILSLLLALVCLFVPTPEQAGELVRYCGYYILLIVLGLFAFELFKTLRFPMPSKVQTGIILAATAVAGLVVFVHANHGYKILMDDAILSATATSIHVERQVEDATLGRNFNGFYLRAESYVDKRPWLYPQLVSIVHDVLGYSRAHPFWVNSMLGAVLLLLSAVFGHLLGRVPGSICSVLLWSTLPLLSQNATGGGLDLLNLVMLQVVVLLSWYYLRNPSPGRLSLLAYAVVLLAYSRYESILFGLPVLGIVLIGWFKEKRIVLSWGAVVAPALLSGLILLQVYLSSERILWELPDGVTERFDFAFIPDNIARALVFFFDTSDVLPNSLLIAVIGVPAVLLALLQWLREVKDKGIQEPALGVLSLFALAIVLHALLIFSYHDGQLDERIASRFSFPLHLLFVGSIVYVLAGKLSRGVHWVFPIALISVFLFGYTLPTNAKAIFVKQNYAARELDWMLGMAESELRAKALIVDEHPVSWTLYEWHCINPAQAKANLERIRDERGRGKYPEIYLVDRLDAVIQPDGQIDFISQYDYSDFEVELIAERAFEPMHMTRIYRAGKILLGEED